MPLWFWIKYFWGAREMTPLLEATAALGAGPAAAVGAGTGAAGPPLCLVMPAPVAVVAAAVPTEVKEPPGCRATSDPPRCSRSSQPWPASSEGSAGCRGARGGEAASGQLLAL